MNESILQLFPKGSEWRKWDLHVHTPFSYESVFSNWESYIQNIKEKAVEHDIEVAGINDYFSIDGYEKLLEVCERATKRYTPRIKLTNNKWLYLFPVVELRLDHFTSDERSVNIHVVFSPDILPSTIRNSFLEKLNIKYQSYSNLNCKTEDLIKIGYAEEHQGNFDTNLDISTISNDDKNRLKNKALKAITFSSLIFEEGIEKFKKILEESGIKEGKYLILIANKGEGGLDKFDWYDRFNDLSRAGNVRQNLLNLSDICFSNSHNDIQFLLGRNNNTPKEEIINRFRSLKPCVWGSDAHTEQNFFHPSNGNTLDYTWIKADPTFEGLKQIIYEPEPSERVWIGPTVPNQKSELKVIQKIRFNDTNDFPDEIEFNQNLCSIIGSRSSGKSALLAYLAHAIDPQLAQKQNPKGPGDGFPWEKVDFQYSVEWKNSLSNDESPGKIVYIPQNYLFEISKKADEIKEKIEPVLFKKFPTFKTRYIRAKNDILGYNDNVSEQIDRWFLLFNQITNLALQLKDFGDKSAVKKEKEKLESQVEKIKKEHHLTESDIRKFQEISAEVSKYKDRIQQIEVEISQISTTPEEQEYFNKVSFTLNPSLENLPSKLQGTIRESLKKDKTDILKHLNKQIVDYKKQIKKEKDELEKKTSEIVSENQELIKQYKKNIKLQELIKELTEYDLLIRKIERVENEKSVAEMALKECEKSIKSEIAKRKSVLDRLDLYLKSLDQNDADIIFDIEYGFDNLERETITQKINTKFKSDFIEDGKLKMDYIRNNPSKFLSAIYLERQKINQGYNKESVSKDILLLSEKILFTAKIDRDKIGGFSEPTMTPGKRAFFALKLILDESNETWPLLIDQPEDDLDSRSIYDSIVPFLKKRKKERQIIMVSHDANLVIGSDSEQIIVANRNGEDMINIDGKQFNYLTGSIEHTKEKDESCEDLLTAQGIREHACEILDGGKTAFRKRKDKYGKTAE